MSKKAWLILTCVVIVIIAIALVMMLILLPQTETSKVQIEEYQGVNQSDYMYSSTKDASVLNQQYSITSEDIESGISKKNFVEGNINPFTPGSQVTIYNEPTAEGNTNKTQLTPNDK